MNKLNLPICPSASWTPEVLDKFYIEIEKIAQEKLKLYDVYPNQMEIISSDQMLDIYTSVGLPVGYSHWSYGKQFVRESEAYKHGRMGLAYEIIINSSPCIAYLMEDNTTLLQALVISHASFGHNYYFANNYLFKQWTSPDSIIDYLVFAKKYISECEEKYGIIEVEEVLDSCHALQLYGVDKYKRPPKLSMVKEQQKQNEREENIQQQVNELWRTIPKDSQSKDNTESTKFISEPEENILYFIEKNAPMLEPWKREIIRIVRKMSQYFYPQRLTKIANEGFAVHTHHEIIHELYDQGFLTDGQMMEYYDINSAVIGQQPYHSKWFNGINPYALGFSIFKDIKRICLDPTEEDRECFTFAGCQDWISVTQDAVKNYKDESFIQQFLSPKVIRDLKLFSVVDDSSDDEMLISAIHDKKGYRHIRNVLSQSYAMSEYVPNIQVYDAKMDKDRTLILRHYINNRRLLNNTDTLDTMKHIRRLWGFNVELESVNEKNEMLVKYTVTHNTTSIDVNKK